MGSLIIGICGGTGSGKTTLAKKIYNALGAENSLLLSMDCYYKDDDALTIEQKARRNYDHPDAFDMELLVSHLKKLKNGESISYPTYDFTTHSRTSEWIKADSKKVIIIEGIMLFANPEITNMLDYKLFVDTDADVRILRRIMRDVKQRGRSLDSVVKQYLTTVKPMHETFIEPYKRLADIIVPEGGHNQTAFDMIVSTLVSKIRRDTDRKSVV